MMQAQAPSLDVLARPAARQTAATAEKSAAVLSLRALNLFYGAQQALFDIDLELPERRISAFIGASGCGKSSLLRCCNRMNELVEGCRLEGQIVLHGRNIQQEDATDLRRRVGMVFQKPSPFPGSIWQNVAFGLRIGGMRQKRQLDEAIEQALISAALWDEVKDRLHSPAFGLSGGQQQRLVIARAIAIEPEVLLLDEPCSALDPISTLKIEELMFELKSRFSVLIVTHNMQQAARVSDFTAFMHLGRVVEFSATEQMFTRPQQQQTEDYISGRYG